MGIVSWCGLLTEEPEASGQQTLIARRVLPRKRAGSGSQLLLRGTDLPIPKQPFGNIDIDGYMGYIRKSFPELPSIRGGRISFRDFTLFNIISQYNMGDPNECFPIINYGFSNWKVRRFIAHLAGEFGLLSDIEINSDLNKLIEKGSFLRVFKDRLHERALQLACECEHRGLISTGIRDHRNLPFGLLYSRLADLRYHPVFQRPANEHPPHQQTNRDSQYPDTEMSILLGRVEEFLYLSEPILSDYFAARKDYLDLRQKQLRSVPQQEPSLFKEIDECFWRYANAMEVDLGQWQPKIDFKNLSIELRSASDTRRLCDEIGGFQNYVALNIAVYLAFHEVFVRSNHFLFHPILVIDQPSQAFTFDRQDKEGEPKRSEARLSALFSAINDSINRSSGALQIIGLERIVPPNIDVLSHTHMIERWCDGASGLLPNEWLAME